MENPLSSWMEKTGDGLFRFRFTDETLLWVNPGFAALVGFAGDPGRVVGKRLSEVFPAFPDREGFRRHLAGQGEVRGLIFTTRTGTGQELRVLQDAFLVGVPTDSDACVECLVRPVPGPEQSGQTVSPDVEARLILDTLPEGLVVIDPLGRIRSMNPQAESLTGWRIGEAAGRPAGEVVKVRREDGSLASEAGLWRGGFPGKVREIPWEAYLEDREGRRRQVAGLIASTAAGGGEPGEVLLVFRDVTARRRQELEQERSRRHEAMSRLAGGVAHDFNNILTGIFGYIGLAQIDAAAQGRQADRLAKAEAALGKARLLSSQLLAFSRGQPPQKKLFLLGEFFRRVAQEACRGAGLECEVHLAPDLLPVDLDEGKFAPAAGALIGHAVRAMGGHGVLRINLENVDLAGDRELPLPTGRYVRVTIRDQGPALSAEELERVFEPYAISLPAGESLGMAMAFSVVKSHGGWLTVRSEPGRGNTFLAYLPASQLLCKEDRLEARPGRVPGRVLLMDDEDIILAVVGEMLQYLGCQVEVARDGDEAVEKFRSAQAFGASFDLVILDLTIPGGKGALETLPLIHALNPQARVVLASGYSTGPVMTEFQKYGFAGAIAKPFEVRHLQEFLAGVLGKA